MNETRQWSRVIRPHRGWLDLRLGEIWRYRYLVYMFVRRDIKASYKQTILGPAWLIIPALITSVTFTLIFGNIAKLSSDGSPHFVFYMAGILMWGLFSACVTGNANTFLTQSGLFSKVYFPRMMVPLAATVSALFTTSIQLVIFMGFVVYYMIQDMLAGPNWAVLLLPGLIVMIIGLALGVGTAVSAITAKYRDLSFLVGYGIQLWMYATTVIYPLSSVPDEYRSLILLNPMTPIVETFRFAFLGTGEIPWDGLAITLLTTTVFFVFGLIMFNRTEQTAMDVV